MRVNGWPPWQAPCTTHLAPCTLHLASRIPDVDDVSPPVTHILSHGSRRVARSSVMRCHAMPCCAMPCVPYLLFYQGLTPIAESGEPLVASDFLRDGCCRSTDMRATIGSAKLAQPLSTAGQVTFIY
jgi:hypothetical protein